MGEKHINKIDPNLVMVSVIAKRNQTKFSSQDDRKECVIINSQNRQKEVRDVEVICPAGTPRGQERGDSQISKLYIAKSMQYVIPQTLGMP